jgi:signal transduction histidine kinase
MSAANFLTNASWVLYLVVFLSTATRVLHRRRRADLDSALFFGAAAAVIVLSGIAGVVGLKNSAAVTRLSGALIMVLPYLLLRLVADFEEVRALLMRGVEVGLGLSLLALIVLDPALPGWVVVGMVAYFVAVIVYASVAFAGAARRTAGVTRRRMEAVALGSLFVGLDVVALGSAALFPAAGESWALLIALLGLVSASSYCIGFSPPKWVRRAWQEPALLAFLADGADLAQLPDSAALIRSLERRVASVLGSSTAGVGLWSETDDVLRFWVQAPGPVGARVKQADPTSGELVYESDGVVFDVRPGHMIAGRAFAAQQAIATDHAARDDPANARYYGRARIRAVLAAPITSRRRRIGVLVVHAPRASIFTDSDIVLVQLLADQIAMLVDSRALLEEAALVLAREQTDGLKDDLLSSIAHDLRNPVTGIRGTAQLLQLRLGRSGMLERERLVAGLVSIEAATSQLMRLIDGLLDYGRLQMDRPIELLVRSTDVVALARKAVAVQQTSTQQHDIQLSSTEEKIVGHWDPDRLERVLQNLLGNALKYSPTGGSIEVRIGRERTLGGDDAVVSILDQGIGIPEHDLAHIFERFHRAANVTGTIAGTGIGLAVSRQIVQQHGGSIGVESEEGRGSTFVVRLPISSLTPIDDGECVLNLLPVVTFDGMATLPSALGSRVAEA